MTGEIIQIGAVIINNLVEMEIEDKYSELIRPKYYKKIHKDVTAVTDLTNEIVDKGRDFKTVCQEFWIGVEMIAHLLRGVKMTS